MGTSCDSERRSRGASGDIHRCGGRPPPEQHPTPHLTPAGNNSSTAPRTRGASGGGLALSGGGGSAPADGGLLQHKLRPGGVLPAFCRTLAPPPPTLASEQVPRAGAKARRCGQTMARPPDMCARNGCGPAEDSPSRQKKWVCWRNGGVGLGRFSSPEPVRCEGLLWAAGMLIPTRNRKFAKRMTAQAAQDR